MLLADAHNASMNGHVTTAADFTSNEFNMSVMAVYLSSNTQSLNGTKLIPLILPNNKITLSLLVVNNTGTALLGALMSVVQLHSLVLSGQSVTSNNSQSSNNDNVIENALTAQKLVSDVVTIQMVYDPSMNHSIPSSQFAANLTVQDSTMSSDDKLYVTHNCSVGLREEVSMQCTSSRVRINVTCTGVAKAFVRRQCPYMHHSCLVLNLANSSVLSSDYCQASVVGMIVQCRCGFQSSVSLPIASIVTSSGRVSVAAFSSFAAGELSSSVSVMSASVAGNVAQQSIVLFVTFVLLWGLGGVLVGVYVLSMVIDIDVSVWTSRVLASESVQMMNGLHVNAFHSYLCSALPFVLSSEKSWLFRMFTALLTKHLHIRIIAQLLTSSTSSHPQSSSMVSESGMDVSAGGVAKRRKHIRNMIVDVIHVMSALTLSCFVLMILYDLQYPSNDEHCHLQTSESTCLYRKSLLDPTQDRCVWKSVDSQSHTEVAATIVETLLGSVVSSESVTVPPQISSIVPCQLNQTSSTIAFVVANVVSMVCSAMLDKILRIVFAVLRADQSSLAQKRVLLRKLMTANQSKNSNKERSVDAFGVVLACVRWLYARSCMSSNEQALGSQARIVTLSEEMATARHNWIVSNEARSSMQLNSATTAGTMTLQLHHQRTRDHKKHRLAVQVMPLIAESSLVTDNERAITKSGEGVHANNGAEKDLCSDEEFAVGLLRSLFADVIAKLTNRRDKTIFEHAIESHFEDVQFVSRELHWLMMTMFILSNGGALYLIVTNAVVRGVHWQWLFEKALLWEWFTELCVMQVLEVLIMYVVVPNSVYTVSQTAIRLLCRADELRMSKQSETTLAVDSSAYRRVDDVCAVNGVLSSNNTYPNTITTRDTNVVVVSSNDDDEKKSDNDSRCVLSQAVTLAKRRPHLIESQLTLYCSDHYQWLELFISKSMSSSKPISNSKVNTDVSASIFMWFACLEENHQQLLVNVSSSVLIAGSVYVWFSGVYPLLISGNSVDVVCVVSLLMVASVVIMFIVRRLFEGPVITDNNVDSLRDCFEFSDLDQL